MKKCYLYAVITVSIWATMATAVKLVLKDIPNYEALFISSVFAFLFLLVVNAVTGKLSVMKKYNARNYLLMAGLGFLGLFLYSALYYYGIGVLGAQEACILNYLWPIMIVIFACIILKESFNVKKLAAVVLSFFGIVVLTVGGSGLHSQGRIGGIAACVLAAVCYGAFSVLNKKHELDQNVTMMIIWLTTALFSLLFGVMTEDFVMIVGMQWLGLIWLGVVVNAVAYLLWALALKGAQDSAKIANLAYLVPFLSTLLSSVVLHEKIGVSAVVALVLIVGGILLQSVNIKLLRK